MNQFEQKSTNIEKKLTARQRKALPYLLEIPNVSAACKKAGIATTTFYSWLKNSSEFRTALEEGRNKLLQESFHSLAIGTKYATNCLIGLSANNQEESTIRLRASAEVLNQFGKFRDSFEIEERIKKLEGKIHEKL